MEEVGLRECDFAAPSLERDSLYSIMEQVQLNENKTLKEKKALTTHAEVAGIGTPHGMIALLGIVCDKPPSTMSVPFQWTPSRSVLVVQG
jgi:hypothetical protein